MKNIKKKLKGVLISALILSLIVSVPKGKAAAYASSDAPSSPQEEVIYVNLNANGNVTGINGVNIFDGEERIYQQKKMKIREIPWNISIRYYLDGKEYNPEEIAGKRGHLKIHFRVSRNTKYSGDFFDNFALQTAFTLDTEKCKNIKAEDATMANVGEDKQLSYILLPGKGIDTYITADVDNFEMDEVSINGLKLNLNIEVDYTDIDEKADEAKDAVKELDDGTGDVLDGTKKVDDAAQELKEKVAELYDGTGKLNDGASELVGGMKEITDKNKELTDGTYEAFEGICTASETILNQQLTANGMSKVSLTPANYERVLNDLLDDLDSSKIYAKAYKQAYAQVSAEVDAYLESEEGQAAMGGAGAGMTDEEKAQIKETYIQQMMQSTEVTTQITSALRKADEAAEQIKDLKKQLDDFRKLYDGVCDYTDAVSKAKDGAEELAENMMTLDENTGLLNDGVIEFRDKIGELLDGVEELKEGTEEFLEEISKLKSEVHDMVSDMIDDLKGKGLLRSFVSDKHTEIESVQFVIKTDAITVDEEPVAEQTEPETLTFWQKLLRLFGLY